jgi:hypothetical protein
VVVEQPIQIRLAARKKIVKANDLIALGQQPLA